MGVHSGWQGILKDFLNSLFRASGASFGYNSRYKTFMNATFVLKKGLNQDFKAESAHFIMKNGKLTAKSSMDLTYIMTLSILPKC